MSRLGFFALFSLLFFLITSSSSAQPDTIKEVTLLIPEARIKKLIEELLPYRVDPGEGFSGPFWLKSVDNLKIGKNRISFTSHIYGKDIYYQTKVGNQTIRIFLGSVNSHNGWNILLRYDCVAGRLFIQPKVKNLDNKESPGRGELLLNTLLQALGNIEFPVEVDKIKPVIVTTLLNSLEVNVKISDIYTENGRVFVEIVPSVKKSGTSKK